MAACGKVSMSEPAGSPPDFTTTVQLLDPSQTYPTQTWKFGGEPVLRIGRAEDGHIVIAQSVVSRRHAELHWCENHWELVNLGRHGTLVDGRSVSRAPLADGATFQLGQAGPVLRLLVAAPRKVDTTMTLAGAPLDLFDDIDESERLRQVSEIADTDYFRQIQEQVRRLRAPGAPSSDSETGERGKGSRPS